MIKEIDEIYWKKIKENDKCSIFYNPDFLNLIADSFRYRLHYLVYEEHGDYLLMGAFYSFKNNIITPLAFTYASILINEGISDRKYITVIKSLISYLKTNFNKISLRLPLEITDVRPFIWEGFSVINRYTYVKNSDLNINRSVKKNYNKALKLNFKIDLNSDIDLAIKLNLKPFRENQQLFINYNIFLINLFKSEDVISFDAFEYSEFSCSCLALIDYKRSKLYTLLITECDNKITHTYLYQNILTWCIQNNIETIDLCGANTEGISNFKSSFNPVLKPYFLISYNPISNCLITIFNKFKIVIKQVLNR